MRCSLTKNVGFFIVFLNVVLVYYTWKTFNSYEPLKSKLFETKAVKSIISKSSINHVSKSTTVVIRDFELHENDVSATVQSFIKVFPNIQIIILSRGLPYPPLQFHGNETVRNVKVINLAAKFDVPYQSNPLSLIKTNYVLFVPDSSRILHRQYIQTMINHLNSGEKMVAVGYSQSKNLTCLQANLTLREWSLKFKTVKDDCDFVQGKHAMMIDLGTLNKLNDPFLLPSPHSIYLQTTYFKLKVKILYGIQFQDGKPLFHSHHSQKLKIKSDQDKFKKLYQRFNVKRVRKENGMVENYGCNRDTARCFGSIINYTPSYIYENKTMPPCCLANLRRTAQHVFNTLHESGIRHWLEIGSLIGAMRTGDVIPWDFDVDIGFNRDDLARCTWLKRASSKPIVDAKGFLWERATEGNFYRVHFSKANRVHVNLLPFYARNGSMLKDAWFTSMGMDFPEHFLHPMSSIEFLGRQVPSPNNIRDFLELKFGRGIVENAHYPDFKFKFT
ncbi:PREDICTED: fukutin-related protein [Nicrophorus vespilloides]|uniref:Fukutin-related protein n=1 Tax=Nicrophorus vespilloides TaxID=110193 RepID=A0ABM1M475_NICVS|nr:PREDICTED: fukutin-related protein [Nicrophorus vespilloides]